jgi:RHS repeat-associated protein
MYGYYRYGFNGKESDNEVKGSGNQQDYGMRIYDPRLGKFLSVDPLMNDYPELTPYQFASNTPIQAIDLDGGERKDATYKTPQETGTAVIVRTQSEWIFRAVQASNNTSFMQVWRYSKANQSVNENDEKIYGSRSLTSQVRGAYGEGVWGYLMYQSIKLQGFSVKLRNYDLEITRSREMALGEASYAFQKNGFDVQFTMRFGGSISQNKLKTMIVGFNEADGSKDFETYLTGTKTFGFEVKTYNPDNISANTNGYKDAIGKLIRETIPLNKNNVKGDLVPVLVMDFDAWNNAYNANPTLMQRLHDKLSEAGGRLMLQPGLYQGTTNQMQQTRRVVNSVL